MDRIETTGLGVSVVGHGALLAILTLGLFQAAAPPAPPSTMEVSFVDEAGLTSAAPEPATEAPAIGAAPDVGPVEDAAPAPAPVPAPTPPQAPVSRESVAPPQRQQPRQQARPSPRPGTGQQTRRSIRNDRSLLAFLGTDPASQSNRAPAQMTGAQRASIRSLIARALMRCQRQPLPAPEAAAIRVDYRVSLNRDGSLASADFVRVLNNNPALEKYERRMRDLALNVINACTPIRGLPAEFYDVPGGWRQFPYQFDPRTVR
jgi:outer membrane biosynthesis protein TonB